MNPNNQTPSMPVLAILGGTGKEGPGLAMRWINAGYKVLIGSRQTEKAQLTAAELNQKLNTNTVEGLTNDQAAIRADICILTVVYTAHQVALEGLRDALCGKILVDATARIDYKNPRPPDPPSAARVAQDLLGPDVRVVAAFQNVPAHMLRRNLDQRLDTDVLVCSDDLEAAQVVIQLANAGGMRAFYVGGLDNAVVVEGLTALVININQHYKVSAASIAITGLD